MQLEHIPLEKLSISGANMRASKKAPDVSDILPSVRARGVLVPLLVRRNGEPGSYEVVAGRRRYFAASEVAQERNEASPLPCAILEDGDDAAALEASLIENVIRLDPDEVTQWEAFARLVKQGRSVEELAATFGISELRVRRTLALGNLQPRVRTLYRHEKIDASTVRHLTLASTEQQREWLKLYDSPEAYAPRAHQLKAWLFDGAAVPTSVALFPLEEYPGPMVADLFGEESYFADAEAFWRLQKAAIETMRQSYLAEGWSSVEILEPGKRFESWSHVKHSKAKGGRVYVELSARGDVSVHEGYLPEKEARKNDKPEGKPEKLKRPQISAPLRDYLDLHRHAAVRAKLLEHPHLAMRLLLAHAIAGSHLWNVRPDPQIAFKEATAQSVKASVSEAIFDKARRQALEKLGIEAEEPLVGGSKGADACVALFQKLLTLPDEDVLAIAGIIMGETLAVASPMVAVLGTHLQLDMAVVWKADDAFLALVRDRELLVEMVAEVAGSEVVKANASEKGAVLKGIIRDCVSGDNGRKKVERWAPAPLAFPPSL